ncbi:MAG: lysine--tRNA ligase, partial [Epsilonproteobacteria bacterium]|nr:lysine--tRNA ligase [Campylobacterota bacterium]
MRIAKANELREMGINPYPHSICKELKNKEFLEKFEYVKTKEPKEDKEVCVRLNGRIKFLRQMGKAVFAKIEDESGIVQIYFNRDSIGADWFKKVKKLIEVGDFIEAVGYPFVTKTGELTLFAKEINLVTKAIVPLPEKFHGLQDKELRYR